MFDSIKKIFSSGEEETTSLTSGAKPDISREKSAQLYEKAKTFFPGGVNSPVRAFKSVYEQ
jgi:glutamate-1-semialdehyde 2,1-aminomutase